MNTLHVGDLHFPYQHRDTFRFLKALAEKFRPRTVIQNGDIVDLHGQSFHMKHPECKGPREEYKAAKKAIKRFETLFPGAFVTIGNHDLRLHRLAKTLGFLPEMLADYNTLWDTKLKFVEVHRQKLADGSTVVATHGHKNSASLNSKHRHLSCNTVCGHRHMEGGVRHYSLPTGEIRWAAQTGCLVDDTSAAFDYAGYNSVLGSVVIENTTPHFIPMQLRANGRWSGRL